MILNANALAIPLADQSVQCVVTSPPYYGLRDYGTAKWEGGDPECDHIAFKKPNLESGLRNDGRKHKGLYEGEKATEIVEYYREVCSKCGAIRIDEQIGLEQTPDEYIANLVAVFRECKRILMDDGTLWVNIGDSYAGSGNGSGDYREDGASISKNDAKYGTHKPGTPNGLKPKDLIGIPWMLAFALRADGWYLRQDIIWAKPNPMPESVKDRCTKSHEYIFLLSKSARYYYDNEAVKEPLADSSIERGKYGWHGNTGDALEKGATPSGGGFNRLKQSGENLEVLYNQNGGRNKRSVWTVTTKPYKGAHYATFNPELIKPCILAGAPEGGIVFDPFVGSGTTVATAIQLGRKGIGLDLSLTYLYENAKDRIKAEMLPLLTLIKQLETQEQTCTKN